MNERIKDEYPITKMIIWELVNKYTHNMPSSIPTRSALEQLIIDNKIIEKRLDNNIDYKSSESAKIIMNRLSEKIVKDMNYAYNKSIKSVK